MKRKAHARSSGEAAGRQQQAASGSLRLNTSSMVLAGAAPAQQQEQQDGAEADMKLGEALGPRYTPTAAADCRQQQQPDVMRWMQQLVSALQASLVMLRVAYCNAALGPCTCLAQERELAVLCLILFPPAKGHVAHSITQYPDTVLYTYRFLQQQSPAQPTLTS
jgi:hypothetical protein